MARGQELVSQVSQANETQTKRRDGSFVSLLNCGTSRKIAVQRINAAYVLLQ
jgi:hypothetical protein